MISILEFSLKHNYYRGLGLHQLDTSILLSKVQIDLNWSAELRVQSTDLEMWNSLSSAIHAVLDAFWRQNSDDKLTFVQDFGPEYKYLN